MADATQVQAQAPGAGPLPAGQADRIEDFVPEQYKQQQSFLTPYRLCLLCAVKVLTVYEQPPDVLQGLLEFLLRAMKSDTASADTSYTGLLEAIAKASSEEFALLTARAVESVNDVRGVYRLLEEQRELLAREEDGSSAHQIFPLSTFGMFVRNAYIAISGVEFSAVVKTFLEFDVYRSRTPLPADHTSMMATDQFVRSQLKDAVGNNLLPAPVAAAISRFAKRSPRSASVHLAQYFAGLQQRDFTMAVEALHRFFDYAAGSSATSMAHYAEAMMADLLVRFGLADEAVTHLEEAIRHARLTAHDPEALRYFQVWQRRMLPDHPVMVDRSTQEVARLEPYSQLLEAEQRLNAGSGPSVVFAAIEQSRQLGDSIMDHTGATQKSRVAAAAAWELFGFHSLSDLYTELSRPLRGQASPDSNMDPATLAAWCALAEKAAEDGDFETVEKTLAALEKNVPRNVSAAQVWMRTSARIDLAAALYKNDLVAVELLLATTAQSLDDVEQRYYWAMYHARVGRVAAAVSDLTALADSLLAGGSPQRARACPVLLAAASILCDNGAFDQALRHIIRVLVVSTGVVHTKCHRSALLLLVRYLVHMKRANDGMEILDQVYPDVLANGSQTLAADAALVFAECSLARLQNQDASWSGLTPEAADDIAVYLDTANDVYTKLENRAGLLRISWLRAAVAVATGVKDEAVAEAKRFLERAQSLN